MKALKKVPGGAKGLSKLPTSVRNKMGYMEEGGKVKKNDKKKDSFEGYTKVGSSKSLNALSLKKRVTSREHPNAQFKYTKDKKGDTMHIYAKYEKGGKIKGLTTAQRKERYMEDLKRKQAAEQKEISGKNFTRLMSGNYDKKDLDERLRIADKATKRLANNREANIYSPQRKKAAAKFDKNTKYDDLLGRSTNPDKKYEKGGKVFKPHKMYKKGCKPEMAKSMKDHLRLKKKGYGHKKV